MCNKAICNAKHDNDCGLCVLTQMECMVDTQNIIVWLTKHHNHIHPSAEVADLHTSQQCSYQAKPMFYVFVLCKAITCIMFYMQHCYN